jgi:hypothetical protein
MQCYNPGEGARPYTGITKEQLEGNGARPGLGAGMISHELMRKRD